MYSEVSSSDKTYNSYRDPYGRERPMEDIPLGVTGGSIYSGYQLGNPGLSAKERHLASSTEEDQPMSVLKAQHREPEPDLESVLDAPVVVKTRHIPGSDVYWGISGILGFRERFSLVLGV